MEDVWTAVRVLIALCGGGCLMWLADRYIKWPEPVAVFGRLIVGILLLLLTVWLVVGWGFRLAIPA